MVLLHAGTVIFRSHDWAPHYLLDFYFEVGVYEAPHSKNKPVPAHNDSVAER